MRTLGICNRCGGPCLEGHNAHPTDEECIRHLASELAALKGRGRAEEPAPHYDSAGRLKHHCTRSYCPDWDENTMRADGRASASSEYARGWEAAIEAAVGRVPGVAAVDVLRSLRPPSPGGGEGKEDGDG